MQFLDWGLSCFFLKRLSIPKYVSFMRIHVKSFFSQLKSVQFIVCCVTESYELAIPQSLPSHMQDYSRSIQQDFMFPQCLFHALIQMNGD